MTPEQLAKPDTEAAHQNRTDVLEAALQDCRSVFRNAGEYTQSDMDVIFLEQIAAIDKLLKD